jgi:hypothetical protein
LIHLHSGGIQRVIPFISQVHRSGGYPKAISPLRNTPERGHARLSLLHAKSDSASAKKPCTPARAWVRSPSGGPAEPPRAGRTRVCRRGRPLWPAVAVFHERGMYGIEAGAGCFNRCGGCLVSRGMGGWNARRGPPQRGLLNRTRRMGAGVPRVRAGRQRLAADFQANAETAAARIMVSLGALRFCRNCLGRPRRAPSVSFATVPRPYFYRTATIVTLIIGSCNS